MSTLDDTIAALRAAGLTRYAETLELEPSTLSIALVAQTLMDRAKSQRGDMDMLRAIKALIAPEPVNDASGARRVEREHIAKQHDKEARWYRDLAERDPENERALIVAEEHERAARLVLATERVLCARCAAIGKIMSATRTTQGFDGVEHRVCEKCCFEHERARDRARATALPVSEHVHDAAETVNMAKKSDQAQGASDARREDLEHVLNSYAILLADGTSYEINYTHTLDEIAAYMRKQLEERPHGSDEKILREWISVYEFAQSLQTAVSEAKAP